ncbi:MAG: apolipoprotein N-acyltransferase [Leptolyngbya sp.]|nr:MAG: apolipoprotein N-acyltransferase [Leptolyngbya sp.]
MPNLQSRSAKFQLHFPAWKFPDWQSLGIAFFSGLAMSLAVAPLNWWGFAWISIAPLWVIVNGERQKANGRLISRTACAIAWGIGYHGSALFEIRGLHPLMWLGIPWLASITITFFCWAFITLWGAALVVIWQGGMRLGAKQWSLGNSGVAFSLSRVLLGTALWCGVETLCNLTPLAWTSISYTQSPGNLAILHLGQLSGAMTVTAAIAAVNGLIAEAWIGWQSRTRDRQPYFLVANNYVALIAMAVLLFVTCHLFGYWLYRQPLNDLATSALKVGIVQGNVPTRIKLFLEGLKRAEVGYATGYTTLVDQGAEAVLTPEGALPFLWDDRSRASSLFYQAVVDKRKVAWLGTFTAQKGGVARSLLTLNQQGEAISRYDKVKLVPLGEYIPFQEWLGTLIGKLTTVAENGLPGTLDQQLDTPFGRAIASICYDSAFPEVFRGQAARGGQFILTASNLDPYSEVLMAQHQAQDLMRAIEIDRWAVRATNTGYSGVIDPHGRIVWRSQPRSYEIHAETIYRRQTQTGYVRWGDWLTPLLLILAMVAGVVRWARSQ